MTAPKSLSSLDRGHSAEQRACEYLLGRGLALRERNYRTPFGEIDLIMDEGDTVVFVEVRMRRSPDYGSPAETVDRRKQGRLRASAEYYLQRQGRTRPCRFDIVALTGTPQDARLEWLQNAF